MIKPNFFVRYGTIITCLLMGGVCFLSWQIRYPETVVLEAVLTIPNKSVRAHVSDCYLVASISQKDISKIGKGQKVIVKFEAYPWQEYGLVSGEVDDIAFSGNKGGFIVHIALPQGLYSNQKRQIPCRQGLKATGEIIVRNTRLAQRLYFDFIDQIDR